MISNIIRMEGSSTGGILSKFMLEYLGHMLCLFLYLTICILYMIYKHRMLQEGDFPGRLYVHRLTHIDRFVLF